MSAVRQLHEAVRQGDVAAEHGRAEAARMLLRHGADPARLDREKDAIPLCWAAFFGRPAVVAVLVEHGSALDQRNKHGLTPLGCTLGGPRAEWRQFSDARLEDWARCAELLRARGAAE